MDRCICVDCPNKCYEYEERIISDKGYWEWSHKEDKCVAESENWVNLADDLIPILNESESEDRNDGN